MALTATLDEFDLIEMNGAFHPKAPIYIFIYVVLEAYSKIGNVLGY